MRVTGIILAGGRARRMGGVDKGLLPLHGKPLVAHVLERLQPQVDTLLINANRELDTYRALGYPVVEDEISGYAGPLAGLHAGMTHAATPLVVTAPCDTPLLPRDLVARLRQALLAHDAQLAVATTAARSQPAFMLCRSSLLPDLTRFLQAGGRKVESWQAGFHRVAVPFDDEANAFANINTPEDLACLGD